MTEKEFDVTQGKKGPFLKTNKERITIRLDPDIIEWFKAQCTDGGSYQSLINDVLLNYIENQQPQFQRLQQTLESAQPEINRLSDELKKTLFALNQLAQTDKTQTGLSKERR
jgi:hypothetical protein